MERWLAPPTTKETNMKSFSCFLTENVEYLIEGSDAKEEDMWSASTPKLKKPTTMANIKRVTEQGKFL